MKKTTSSRLTRTNVFSSIFHFPSKTWIFESQKAFTVKLIFNFKEILYQTFKMMTSIALVTDFVDKKVGDKTYSSDIGGIFIDSFDSLLSVHVDGPLHPFSNFLLSYVHSKKRPTFNLISTLNWKRSSIWILWLTKLLKIRPSLAHFLCVGSVAWGVMSHLRRRVCLIFGLKKNSIFEMSKNDFKKSFQIWM